MSNCGTGAPQDDDDNAPMPPAPAVSPTCVKCLKAPSVIHVRSSSYCNECFLANFKAKFKHGMNAALRRSRYGTEREQKVGKRDGRRSSILVAFSGGPASVALLDLVKNNLKEPERNPKDRRPPTYTGIEVAYIDESGVPGAVDHTEEARLLVEAAGLAFLPLKLSSIFDLPALSASLSSPTLPSASSTSTSSTLSNLFSSLPPTSLAALRSTLIQSLLRRTALARSHEILLTGETATRLAIKTISGMTEGRGWALGEEVGAEWESEDGRVLVIRPLGLALAKEVEYFLDRSGLEEVGWVDGEEGIERERLEGERDVKKKGIGRLTEDFVLGLEANFPSTVSTITRTAGKLGLRTADAEARGARETPCPLCGLPAQIGASEWRNAVTVSSFEPLPSASSASTPPALPPAPHTETPLDDRIPLAQLMCYGCLLILEGVQQQAAGAAAKGPTAAVAATRRGELLLPAYVGEAARRRWGEEGGIVGTRVVGREEVERTAREFLLD